MLRSIATVSLSGTLGEKLRAVQRAGFDGVEIFENDLLYFDGSPGDVRRMCEDLGLRITLFQPFRNFEGVDPAALHRNLERARRKFDLMHQLGTDRILVCSNVDEGMIGDDNLIIDQLGMLAHAARASGVIVGFEALAWGRHVRHYRHAWRLVDAVDDPHLGLVLDSFHTLSLGDDLDGIASIPGERIAFVQIADAPAMTLGVLEWSRHYRCFPGQGDLDVAGFTARALESGYAGPLSLEIFNDSFRAAPTTLTAADGYRSLLFLEAEARRRMAPAPAARPSSPVSASRPAAPPRFGFQYLEFATDGTARPLLDRLLRQVGFRQCGEHRSKNVTLYQQNNATLILNAETDSSARAFFNAHGLSLCASAYRVSEAQATLQRATAFGYLPFQEKVGENERVIPALRAPDNSLIYLVDETNDAPTLYHSDFVFNDDDAPASIATIDAIDYLSLNLPVESLDTWTLFFRSVFGFEAAPRSSLPDPYGLVHRRLLHSPDQGVRIMLNGSADPRTAVAQALDIYHGSGLNHIAFSTSDIFATVARLRANGLSLLRISANYYDDLGARYGFSDAHLTRLREAGILYDRDAHGGEFHHVYTEQFERRFCLEIVQRTGGYAGYGETNAAARLAALAQRRSDATAS